MEKKFYEKLCALMEKKMEGEYIDVIELALVLGVVEGFRRATDARFPEIELAYCILREVDGRRYEECLR